VCWGLLIIHFQLVYTQFSQIQFSELLIIFRFF
jgi:hypothetical protein